MGNTFLNLCEQTTMSNLKQQPDKTWV